MPLMSILWRQIESNQTRPGQILLGGYFLSGWAIFLDFFLFLNPSLRKFGFRKH